MGVTSGRGNRRGWVIGPGMLGAWILLAAIPAAAPAQWEGEDEIRHLLDQVFDGMKQADSARVAAAFAEGARFAVLREREGTVAVEYAPIQGWLNGIANSAGRWEEILHDVEIRVDGTLAMAWTPYTFYLDGRVRHCGVNAVMFLRTAAGWRITQLSDTQRLEGCRHPPGTPR